VSIKVPLTEGERPLQGYLAHKKKLPPLGPLHGPRHGPTAWSQGEAVSYERGTPVRLKREIFTATNTAAIRTPSEAKSEQG
jgi:hypothetical protein